MTCKILQSKHSRNYFICHCASSVVENSMSFAKSCRAQQQTGSFVLTPPSAIKLLLCFELRPMSSVSCTRLPDHRAAHVAIPWHRAAARGAKTVRQRDFQHWGDGRSNSVPRDDSARIKDELEDAAFAISHPEAGAGTCSRLISSDVCVCVCTHACVYVCTYVCMSVCMIICMYVCACLCMLLRVHGWQTARSGFPTNTNTSVQFMFCSRLAGARGTSCASGRTARSRLQ